MRVVKTWSVITVHSLHLLRLSAKSFSALNSSDTMFSFGNGWRSRNGRNYVFENGQQQPTRMAYSSYGISSARSPERLDAREVLTAEGQLEFRAVIPFEYRNHYVTINYSQQGGMTRCFVKANGMYIGVYDVPLPYLKEYREDRRNRRLVFVHEDGRNS